jgi:putative ATPase
MKGMGYGKGYKYAHDYPGHFVEQQNLPGSLQGKRFYLPSDQGFEKQINARLKNWREGRKPSQPEKGEAE